MPLLGTGTKTKCVATIDIDMDTAIRESAAQLRRSYSSLVNEALRLGLPYHDPPIVVTEPKS